jgi:hypothetical protein
MAYKRKLKGLTNKSEQALPNKSEQKALPNTITDGKLTLEMLALLPVGVSRPTYHTGYIRVDGEAGWWDTSEYAGLIHKLLTSTLDELKADNVWIPVWRYHAGTEAIAA